MGTDDLFHKKKLRNESSLQRRKNQRSPYEVGLIVCGGTRTEFNYFKGLRDELRLNTANIKIFGKEFDPIALVEFAIKEFNTADYDKVFCVFDRDDHPRYHQALDKIKTRKKFQSITSIPCLNIGFCCIMNTQMHPSAITLR